jgi:hypothetical protein
MVRASSALVTFTVLVAVVGVIGMFGFAGAARADGPPITVFPPAGETAPPANTITDPSACSGWYRQSDYGGLWPTDSTWWEYSCNYTWPSSGTGATNANWWGQDNWTDYFYWDGSKPVHYGENFYDGYSDGWIMASYCSYWFDAVSSWSGQLSCD